MLKINFTPFPELTTERLLLRQLKPEDAKELFALRTNEIVNRYIDRPKTNSVEEIQPFIARINTNISTNQTVYWVITLKANPGVIGTITLWKISPENYRAEIGYELLPSYHGKGIMQEAFAKVTAYGFETLKLKTIVAFTNKDNGPSKKLLEKNNFRVDLSFEELKTEAEKENTLIYSCSVNTG